jgi:spore germination protein
MSKKKSIVILSFAAALILGLGIYSVYSGRRLRNYRRAAEHAAQLAFEETVEAVDSMSDTIRKSPYATDGAMCGRICSQVYADARAAEAAMSTLPFATQELEQLSAYLNQAGDYAYTMCSGAAENGFTGEQIRELTELAESASSLSGSLEELRRGYHEGSFIMDSREKSLRNIGAGREAGKISGEMLRFESEFPKRANLSYDGIYSDRLPKTGGSRLSDAEMLAMAADFAGVSPAELKLSYEFEGTDGRKCYSSGDMQLCLGPKGVEGMNRSRLVPEKKLSLDEAEKKAEEFLEKHHIDDLLLTESGESGNVANFKFACVQDDAVCLDSFVKLAVAMDDGSVLNYNAADCCRDRIDARWTVDADEAAAKTPENLSLENIRKVIIHSPGGENTACYELKCTDTGKNQIKIYINAETGKQADIVL